MKLGSGTAIVLTDRSIVRECLDRRSATMSGRPQSEVAGMITGGDHLLIMDYGPAWRDMRKLIHQEFTEALCERDYIKIQEAEAAQLLRDCVLEPEHFMMHPRRFSNSIVMSVCRHSLRSPPPVGPADPR